MRESLYLTKMKSLSLSETSQLKREIQEKWSALLLDEILDVNPRFILSFGSTTWIALRDNLLKEKALSKTPVTQVHGLHYPIENTNTTYIPMAFFPGTSRYLRNSYFEYFEQELNRNKTS